MRIHLWIGLFPAGDSGSANTHPAPMLFHLEIPRPAGDDDGMEPTELRPSPLPLDLQADTEAVMEHITRGTPLDPEVRRRVRQRAERIRDEVYRQHGLLDIGVPAIRALRDDE